MHHKYSAQLKPMVIVFLVNNNGFTFGQNAVIDTQGFLATTFSLGLNDDNVLLTDPTSGAGTGKITLGNLDIANDTQYIAFYSENIDVTGNVQDNSTGNDALLSLNTQTSAGSITLPGLAIGFTTDTINPSNQNLTIKNNSLSDHGSLVSNNGMVTLNSSDLSGLFTGNVKIPNLISAESIRKFQPMKQ
ncbi:two-partner secretion domain-containing protein [Pseudomonas sp. HK3]